MEKIILIILVSVLFLVTGYYIYNSKLSFTNDNTDTNNYVQVPLITKGGDLNPIYNKFKSRFEKSNTGKPLSGIDAVYVITMPQRKKYITEQINNLGINAIYLDAITSTKFKRCITRA